jgi:HEXXH motif-containing protein
MTSRLPVPLMERIFSGFGTAGDSETLWNGQLGKRLLQLRLILDRADSTALTNSRFRESYRTLASIQRTNPIEIRTLLLSPQFGAYLAAILRKTAEVENFEETAASWSDKQLQGELACLGGFAAVAALRRGSVFRLATSILESRIFLPTLGFVETLESTEASRLAEIYATRNGRLWISGLGVVASRNQSPRRLRWHSIPTVNALEDVDPDFCVSIDSCDYFMVECSTLPLERAPLSGNDLDQWKATLQKAMAIIRRRHSDQLPVVRSWVKVILPAVSSQARISASSRDMPGALIASLPATAIELVESVIHEVQHCKLNALDDLTPLFHDSEEPLPVPWGTTEQRPSLALAQGAYAFTSVVEFLTRESKDSELADPRDRTDTLVGNIQAALTTLQTSKNLTSTGTRLVQVLRRRLSGIY